MKVWSMSHLWIIYCDNIQIKTNVVLNNALSLGGFGYYYFCFKKYRIK